MTVKEFIEKLNRMVEDGEFSEDDASPPFKVLVNGAASYDITDVEFCIGEVRVSIDTEE